MGGAGGEVHAGPLFHCSSVSGKVSVEFWDPLVHSMLPKGHLLGGRARRRREREKKGEREGQMRLSTVFLVLS